MAKTGADLKAFLRIVPDEFPVFAGGGGDSGFLPVEEFCVLVADQPGGGILALKARGGVK